MSNCCADPSSRPADAGAEPVVQLCPECRRAGRGVGSRTLKHMVLPQHLGATGKPGFLFCRTADCEVVYFHPDGERLRKADLRVRVGLKETGDPVPVCYCFGFTERMLFEELQATGECTIPQRIAAEMKAGFCACEVRNPQGSCCLGNVRAAVKRLRQELATRSQSAGSG